MRYAARIVRPSRAIVSVRVFLYAALTAVLSACAGSTSDFDRVAPPVRFADIRETASWVGSFDPAWWSTIDAAYAEYDRSIDAELVASWDAFCADVAEERLRGKTPDARRARMLAGKYVQLDRQLDERERLFIAALERSLPRAAEPFVTLLGARVAFHRATGILRDPGQRLPAPLEVLQLVGRVPLVDAQIAVAASAYAKLASDGAVAARKRVQRYVEACKELEPILAELDAVDAAERTAPDDAARKALGESRERVGKERDAIVVALAKDSQRTLEVLRESLVREGRWFAQALSDPDRCSVYLEQLDFALFDGIRVAPGIEAFASIARNAIARALPEDAKALEDLDALVEQEVARARTLRVALASGSPAARRQAYEALQKVGEPVGAFVDRKLKQHGGLWRVLERTVDVMAGVQSAEAAASLVLSPPPPEPTPPEPYVPPGRDRNLLILMGSPLPPVVIESLIERLRIGGEASLPLRERVRDETDALAKTGGATVDAIGDDFRELGRVDQADRAAAVRRFLARLDGHVAGCRAQDEAATTRVLAEAARIAGVDADDDRVAIARLELDLMLEVGTDRDTREAETFAGVLPTAIVNPFDLMRTVARTDEERAAAEDLLLSRGDALRTAHRELASSIRRNLRDFMLELLRGGGFNGIDRNWRPKPAGVAAAQLRVQLVRDFSAAIGEDFAERYEAGMRGVVMAGADPMRPAAITALERFVAGAGALPGERAATADDRAVVRELLAQANERRTLALRALLEWRADWIRLGDFRDRDSWRELERVAPRGWLLRARASDADERALAACAAALEGADAGAGVRVLGLDRFPVVMPRRMRPFFE